MTDKEKNAVKQFRFAVIFAVWLSFFGCQYAATNQIEFVDRNAGYSTGENQNPLTLVVAIDENGKLSLNKIETGTIDDAGQLSEKLRSVFDDREKSAIVEREVLIEMKGKIKKENLEKLIESLSAVKASPIRIIKNSL